MVKPLFKKRVVLGVEWLEITLLMTDIFRPFTVSALSDSLRTHCTSFTGDITESFTELFIELFPPSSSSVSAVLSHDRQGPIGVPSRARGWDFEKYLVGRRVAGAPGCFSEDSRDGGLLLSPVHPCI